MNDEAGRIKRKWKPEFNTNRRLSVQNKMAKSAERIIGVSLAVLEAKSTTRMRNWRSLLETFLHFLLAQRSFDRMDTLRVC